jgi:hypothetical protein
MSNYEQNKIARVAALLGLASVYCHPRAEPMSESSYVGTTIRTEYHGVNHPLTAHLPDGLRFDGVAEFGKDRVIVSGFTKSRGWLLFVRRDVVVSEVHIPLGTTMRAFCWDDRGFSIPAVVSADCRAGTTVLSVNSWDLDGDRLQPRHKEAWCKCG